MALPSFRKFDVQARFGLLASCAAFVPLAVGAVFSFGKYSHQLRAISYGEAGMFKPALLVCIALAGGLSVIGLALGFNSAGQRRNKNSGESWAGFFLGTAVLSLTIILFVTFRSLGFEIAAG